ncbi:MAG: hypothetical protein AB7I01_02155 [Gammaproteobacteria bacterium]
MQRFMHRITLAILALLGAAHCAPAGAGTITIDFSGTFALYHCLGCQPNALESLLGTSFSGSVSFPDSAAEATSVSVADPSPTGSNDDFAHSVRAAYSFAPGSARLRVDTVLDAFDFDGTVLPTVLVQNCTGFGCPAKDDFLWVLAETPSLMAALYIGGGGQFEDVEMPSFALLESLSSLIYFDIETPDNLAVVSVATDFPSPLQVTLTSDATTVPLPGALPLFGAGLLAAARRLRRTA